jgi:hypothetical protein
MKRIFFIVSLFVVVCLAQIAEPKHATAATTKQPEAVIILQCQISGSTPATVVFAVDGSLHSPSINTGGSCAEALLELVTDGFTLEGVQILQLNGVPGSVLVYTMVRTT